MGKLEYSKIFERNARCGPLDELDVPTWDLTRQAIAAGQKDDAIELLDYNYLESKVYYDSLMLMTNTLLKVIGDTLGDEGIERIWRERYTPRIIPTLQKCKTVEDSLQRICEGHRGHFTKFKLSEEPDRFVISADPCGSGGQMRRSTQPAATRQAHPWSWSKAAVPYYCTHCCIMMELLPTEIRGYPMVVHEYNDNPNAPCVQYYYKDPKKIPEKYFTRLGHKKDISKYKQI